MRACILNCLLLLSLAFQVQARPEDESKDKAKSKDEGTEWMKKFKDEKSVREFFKSIFLDGPKGSKFFEDFVKQSTKAIKGGPGEEQKDEKPKEVPLGAKVFAFYMKTYGCQNSKVYKEFLEQYKAGKLAGPKQEGKSSEEEAEWLNDIAAKGVEVDEADTKVEAAEKKIKSLEKDEKGVLADGEQSMPSEAQTFLKFVKYRGCEDKIFEDYKKFNTLVNDAVKAKKEKGGGKAIPVSYYPSKAESILNEEFSS